MKKLFAVAGIAFVAACAESNDPTGFDIQHTIDLPGNVLGTYGCQEIDLVSCFAILDNQIKILYERSAWAARRGEADYKAVTGSNKDLSYIFQGNERSVPETLAALDNFIADVETGLVRGDYSACWGEHILGFALWVRGKVASGNVDVSDAPLMTCTVSAPASVAGSGTETNGVVLTIDDPWHYSGDPYGVYSTGTYFVIEGPSGTITTPMEEQDGAETFVIADAATKAVGTHQYSVAQCSSWGDCSEAVTTSVTIAEGSTGGGDPGCVHDRRDKAPGKPDLPICKKDKKK